MKNLLFLSVVLILVVGCQKDNDISVMELQDVKETVNMTNADIARITTEQKSNPSWEDKMSQLNHSGQFRDTTIQSNARTEIWTSIWCGFTENTDLRWHQDDVSYYWGQDKIYHFAVNSFTDVRVELSNLQTDIDVFIAEVDRDFWGFTRVGETVMRGINPGTKDEVVVASLPAGEYLIIVDCYQPGPYTMNYTCQQRGNHWGNRFENFEDYGIGTISNQSSNWSYDIYRYYDDAEVRYFDFFQTDQSLYLEPASPDRISAGYDFSWTGFGQNWGITDVEFEMTIANGNMAQFGITRNSTNSYGGTQYIAYFTFRNGKITCFHKGTWKTAATSYPSKTFKVHVRCDLLYDRIYVTIGDLQFILKARGAAGHHHEIMPAVVEDLAFMSNFSESEFYIDNINTTYYSEYRHPGIVSNSEMIYF